MFGLVYFYSNATTCFPRSRLSDEDIEKMVKDAETFAEEDKKLKEKVEARNELESFVYSLKNQVNICPYWRWMSLMALKAPCHLCLYVYDLV